jgi:hypothetical protein
MDKRIKILNKESKYIIGGVDGISSIISKFYLSNDSEIKRQILIGDRLFLDDINCYQVHDLGVIIKHAAYEYFGDSSSNYVDSAIGSFDFLKFYDKENINVCVNIINNSGFDDDDKRGLLKIIKNHKFDFSLTDQISELYDVDSIYRLIGIIEFTNDYTIEK